MSVAAVALLLVALPVVAILFRTGAFLALLTTAVLAALALGIPLAEIGPTVERGIGSVLGALAVIICLGAMLGQVLVDGGAARRIATDMVRLFGRERLLLALGVTGFVVGIPLFYNVGFVILVPILLTICREMRLPPVRYGIPLLAGLSIAHGFLPPHPAPAAIVTLLGADLGRTLLLGIVVAIPTLLIAGPLFALTLSGVGPPEPRPDLTAAADSRPADPPGSFISFLCALLPVLLIALVTLLLTAGWATGEAAALLSFLGNPATVFLLSLGFALIMLRLRRGAGREEIAAGMTKAIQAIAGLLLIIGAAGALKEVLVTSGTADALSALLKDVPLPPLLIAWLVAAVIRIALGSATVAGLTAAGIVQPMLAGSGIDPDLAVLAIGAGSLMCSHVNDPGFWMFKEYFGLSLRETFRSWTIMESIVGVAGLLFVLAMDRII